MGGGGGGGGGLGGGGEKQVMVLSTSYGFINYLSLKKNHFFKDFLFKDRFFFKEKLSLKSSSGQCVSMLST